MALSSRDRERAGQSIKHPARVLLVDENLRELAYYQATLQKLGCKVRACSSFTEGVQCLGCEPFNLIMVDQGSAGFEGKKVAAEAMEVDVELRVLVLAKSYNKSCHCDAMLSGALDYLEGPLSPDDIVALLDTFMPHQPRGHSTSSDRVEGTSQARSA